MSGPRRSIVFGIPFAGKSILVRELSRDSAHYFTSH
jgi:hypothetical protein